MRLRVLTYNIHKAIGVDRKFAPDRIVEILRHHSPDVALLQEVDRGVPRSRMLDLSLYLARHLDYPHHVLGLTVYLRRGRYGNATLSRYPIGRQRNIDLTIGLAKRRGAQHTCLHVPCNGGEIAVDIFNVHLSLLARLRRIQVQRLLDTQDVLGLGPESPCIVAGDMNDWQGALQEGFFSPAGFACATNPQPGSRRPLRTFPSFAPTGGLDKIFYRGALRLVHVQRSHLAIARVASDHLPVIAEWEVGGEGC